MFMYLFHMGLISRIYKVLLIYIYISIQSEFV